MAIFADRTKDLIKQSVELARRMKDEDRKAEVSTALDYLEGNQAQYIQKNPGESERHFRNRPKIVFPFTDLVISDLSLLYKLPPVRVFDPEKDPETESKNQSTYREWMDEAEDDGAPPDLVLLSVDKKTRLCGNGAVRVLPNDEDATKATYPRFDLFTPDQVDVICDPKRPNKAVSVVLYINQSNTGFDKTVAQVWTAEETCMLHGDAIKDRQPNPLGEIPVVFFANELEFQEFWSIGYDRRIVPISKSYDTLWSSFIWGLITQAHGTPVGKNVDPNWRSMIEAGGQGPGPDSIVLVGDDGEFDYKSPGFQIEQFLQSLETMIKRCYWLCGLPVNRFTQESAPESGFAKMMENMSVIEDRELRATTFRPIEKNLWRLAFKVMKTWVDGNITEPEVIGINYAEPRQMVPQSERLEEVKFNLDNHMTTLVELMIEADSDLDHDRAKEKLMQNKLDNEEVTKKATSGTVGEIGALLGLGGE